MLRYFAASSGTALSVGGALLGFQAHVNYLGRYNRTTDIRPGNFACNENVAPAVGAARRHLGEASRKKSTSHSPHSPIPPLPCTTVPMARLKSWCSRDFTARLGGYSTKNVVQKQTPCVVAHRQVKPEAPLQHTAFEVRNPHASARRIVGAVDHVPGGATDLGFPKDMFLDVGQNQPLCCNWLVKISEHTCDGQIPKVCDFVDALV